MKKVNYTSSLKVLFSDKDWRAFIGYFGILLNRTCRNGRKLPEMLDEINQDLRICSEIIQLLESFEKVKKYLANNLKKSVNKAHCLRIEGEYEKVCKIIEILKRGLSGSC